MRACTSCGSPVAESATFCQNCGTPVSRPCPACRTPVAADARFCPNCGTELTPAIREEERKVVTILFADVTGSTALGERLDPERLRSLLNAYFSAMAAVIESWGGTVEKYIGDAIMAAFGVPLLREDDPARALRAALGMLARLDDINREFEERHGVRLQIRIGVNTGDVISPVGGPVDQLIVAGDAVNVAARLEQAAESGSTMVGERTYLATRGGFEFEPPVDLALKGKSGAVQARRLVSALPEAIRGIPGIRSAMVGRDREMGALAGLLQEAVETSRPRMVVVYGPAGIGKSRLVEEFVRTASSAYEGATVLRGRCPAAGQGITYWALGEILRSAAGIALRDPVEVAADKLRSSVSEALSGVGVPDSDVLQSIFALAMTAGISMPDNPLEHMEPRAVADELSRAWPRFAAAYAARGPTVFVVEDLHWAEAQLLDMLERLLARTEGPLLLVTTARPEFAQGHPEFGAAREDFSTVSLRPLTQAQSAELMEGLLTEAHIHRELREEILAKAEGNPFFLEEIIRRLIDEGAIVREGDRWTATSAARTVVLPDTVHGLLAARIDALPREEKRVLQEAAVIGRVFWEEPVARSMGNGEVSSALLRLERRGLVFARPTSTISGQIEFMFKHALVRDVAYASLPKARRAKAHAEHAAWIEELAGGRLDEFVELIAHHYRTAAAEEDADLAWADVPGGHEEVCRKAFEALIRAGVSAKRRSALRMAVELHQQAFELALSDEQRVLALEELGDDHAASYHGNDAVDAYRRAIEVLKEDPGGLDELARVCSKAARMIVEKGGAFRVQLPGSQADEFLRLGLEAVRDRETRAWLLSLFGQCALYWRTFGGGDPIPIEDRIGAAEQGIALAEEIGRPELLSLASRTLSELYMSEGEHLRAVEAARRQLAMLERIASAGERALTLFEVSTVESDLASDYSTGLDLAGRSHEIAKSLSAHDLMHSTYAMMLALYHLGRWDEVLSILDEHLSVFDQERDVLCYAVRGGPFVGGLVLAHRGDADRARAIANDDLGDPDRARPGLLAAYAEVLLACGDRSQGRSMAETAWGRELESKASMKSPWDRPLLAVLEARLQVEDTEAISEILPAVRRLDEIPRARILADRAEGLVHLASGKSSGVRLLRSAIDEFEGLSLPFDAARTRELLARAVPDKASELLSAALETHERLGATPHIERVRAALVDSG
jgi:class 3 adenylate cyclase/tetratricopeptide (TPR) repeat protein